MARLQRSFGYFEQSSLWKGELFLSKKGLVAVMTEGVYAPTDGLHTQIRAFGEDGILRTRRGAVPAVKIDRARQILLDDWTLPELVVRGLLDAYKCVHDCYTALGWLKALFWPTLAWLIAVISATTISSSNDAMSWDQGSGLSNLKAS